jgi:hypothetical protein
MKKILALVLACAGLMASGAVDVTGNKISLLNVYEWSKDASGNVTVTPHDPFNVGGWSASIVDNGVAGELTFATGFTMYELPQSFKVDYASRRVTLEVTGQPFYTREGHSSTTSGAVTTTIDSTMNYYFVNEDWLVGRGAMADVKGSIQPDGSIVIDGGYGYYILTVKTTTMSTPRGVLMETSDTTRTSSLLMRNTRLLTPNGVHEFVDELDGTAHSVDVYISQQDDTVTVVNLFGLGSPSNYMVLSSDGTMSFPGQTIRDISDAENPNGNGVWANMTVIDGTPVAGNQGNVTPQAITWGLTTPSDGADLWWGYDNNRLYYSDGTTFVLPSLNVLRGDVDGNGDVDINDVTRLIDVVLGKSVTYDALAADCNVDDGDGNIDINDVTALINFILYGSWAN